MKTRWKNLTITILAVLATMGWFGGRVYDVRMGQSAPILRIDPVHRGSQKTQWIDRICGHRERGREMDHIRRRR